MADKEAVILNILTKADEKCFSGRDKGDTHLHVTDLIELCARKVALCEKHSIPFHTRSFIGSGLAYVFEMGRKIQEIVCDKFVRQGTLTTHWHCNYCDSRWFGFKGNCPKCKDRQADRYQHYNDTLLLNNFYGVTITGSVDAPIALTQDTGIITEIKSIAAKEFPILERPLRKNLDQASLYPWLWGHKGTVIKGMPKDWPVKYDTKTSYIIYATKGGHKPPFKVFKVPYNPKLIEGVEKQLMQLKNYKSGKRKRLPDKVCSVSTHSYARRCQVVGECGV